MLAPKNFAPLMLAPQKRIARLVLSAAVAGVFVFGCDSPSSSADKSARSAIAQAQSAVHEPDGAEKAIQLLSTAGGNAEAFPETRVRANAMVGQLLLEQARNLAWDVDRIGRDSQRLSMEIAQLAGEAQFAGQLAAGYKQLDPTPVINNLSKQAEDARGGADRAVWFEAAGVKFPSLAAVAADLSKLEGDIAVKQGQLADLVKQRDGLLSSAEDAARTAEAAKGRSAVEAYTRASNLRKQAADISVQIETATAALEPLKRDAAMLASRKEYIAAAAKQLEEQGASMQGSWVTIQKAGTAQSELAKKIVSGGDASEVVALTIPEGINIKVESLPAGSIAEKAAKLAELDKQATEQRAAALEKLTAASKHFEDATAAADAARQALDTAKTENPGAAPGQLKAIDISRNAMSAATYRVQNAAALTALAELHANHAASLDLRLKLQALAGASLATAGVNVPEALNNSAIQGQYEQALKEADEAYKAADELYANVLEAGQNTDAEKAAAEAAKVARVFELYAWSILAADMNAPDQAKAHMDLAKSIVTDAATNGTRFPALPAELATALPVKAPSDAPPSDGGTAQPDGATPPADGATPPADGATPPAEGTPPAENPPAEGAPPVEQPPTENPPQTPPGGGPG